MMTDDQIIKVVRAHKEGKKIQRNTLSWHDEHWVDDDKPDWDFTHVRYRVAPEPPKPIEWYAEIPIDGSIGQIFTDSRQLTKGGELVKVREVI